MKALFRNLSSTGNRSESTADSSSRPHQPRTSLAPGISPLIAQSIPWQIPSYAPGPASAPVPIPHRRQSEPPPERWARPTLPSYAVSRVQPSPRGQDVDDIPSYQAATSLESSSLPRVQEAADEEDDRFRNWAAREYFGSSPAGEQAGDGIISNLINESALNTSEEGHGAASTSEDVFGEDDDDPLIPRRAAMPARRYTTAGQPSLQAPEDRFATLSTSLGANTATLDLPRPAAEPPMYSPSLGRDELRLISTVHLASDHPAAAFFNAIASSPTDETGTPITRSQGQTTVGQTSAAAAENGEAVPSVTATGGKKLKITITKGGHRTNANGTGPLYIRLARGESVEGTVEVGKVDHAVGLEVAIVGLVNVQYYVRGQYTVVDTLPLARRKMQLFPPIVSSSSAIGTTSTATPDSQPMIAPGTKYNFSLKMPYSYYRDKNVELPPTCDLQQIGLQASVEYVLRVKLSRKRFRWNDELTVPIIYEPRAYIPPPRLRALTWDDALNPGWRKIDLGGGKPTSKSSFLHAPAAIRDAGPGVNVSLLLPSPPILFIPTSNEFPTFPFHLHFHSELPHPLATFSDPTQSRFVIRLTRVALMRVGLERETRRLEIPTKVQLWQEGGERMTLDITGQGVVTDSERSASAAGNGSSEATGQDGSAISSSPAGESHIPNPLRRYSSSGSGTSDRRRSFSLGDRLRRRGSSSSQASTATATAAATAGPLSPSSLPTSLPPIIQEEHAEHDESQLSSSFSSSTPPISQSQNQAQSQSSNRSPLAPLSLSSTDVHLQGCIQIDTCTKSHADVLRRLIQSFATPELTLTYVVEVTIFPKKGAVKEAFGHVWGGGIVEVVLGKDVRNRG
ncbi:hypothetical protein I316_01629 [Kwoniella heveanensis BCC8398]|uniref:Uncharacterized protein n=1 Tax=Kwoniella heveanensis BCC8398 TaxID=1296120 RepID=A0A1B9GZE2_9TREE|nr:hypothetical protein I316_01629 [Kwoniella heveanensis BCC8398]